MTESRISGPARSSGQSLSWRLPLSLSALMAGVLAAFLWASYREVEATLARAGVERARGAAGQLANLFDRSVQQSAEELRRTAADPEIQAFLVAPTDDKRAAALKRLAPRPGASARRIELWSAGGARVLEIVPPAGKVPPPLPTAPAEAGFGPLQAEGALFFSDAVAEVVAPPAAGSRRLGFVVVRSTISVNPPGILTRLLGEHASLAVGNTAGGLWTDLSTIVPAPPVGTPGGVAQYIASNGERRLGAAAEIRGTPWSVWVAFPRTAVVAPARTFLNRMLVTSAFVVLVGAALVRAVTRRLTTPLIDLTRAAEAIADGEYNRRVEVQRRDEIGRLGVAFNAMVAQIEDGQRRLQNQVRERTEALEALGKSEAHYRAIVQVAFDCVIIVDASGRVTEFNPAAERTFGYTRDQAIGRDLASLIIPVAHQAAQRAWFARWATTGEGKMLGQLVEITAMRADGSEFPAELAHGAIISESGGRMLTTVIRDITSRKAGERERRALEEQLRQAQKMEAIGRLAGGIAHDFNNLLTAILGYCTFVLEQLPAGHPARGDLAEIQKAGDSAASLTRQLLAFSRRQVLQPEVLDLNDVVQQMDGLLRRLIGEDIALESRLTRPLDMVNVDRGQVEQIIMNLAVNARDAMPNGGLLTIETGNVVLDESYVAKHPGATIGPHAMIAVSDNGTGMSAETLSHVFEPFFTTKPRGEGTGLGLATVYGIVKQSGGSVWVYSEEAQGTTLKIYLPRATEEERHAPVATAASRSVAGAETILLAEDQADVRTLATRILTRSGYTVLDATSGAEALRIVSEYRQPIHLLLTDVIMPGMSGRDLVGSLQRTHPEIRVLYASGYTDDAIVRHGVLDPGVAFLEKPFTPKTLLSKVREVLDGPPASSAA